MNNVLLEHNILYLIHFLSRFLLVNFWVKIWHISCTLWCIIFTSFLLSSEPKLLILVFSLLIWSAKTSTNIIELQNTELIMTYHDNPDPVPFTLKKKLMTFTWSLFCLFVWTSAVYCQASLNHLGNLVYSSALKKQSPLINATIILNKTLLTILTGIYHLLFILFYSIWLMSRF